MFDKETKSDEKHRQYKELQKCERANKSHMAIHHCY